MLVFDERHVPGVTEVVELAPYAEVQLKGFSASRRLVVYRGHRPVAEFMRWGDVEQLKHLAFFRDDKSLTEILAWLCESWMHAHANEIFRVIGQLRLVKLTQLRREVRDGLVALISDLMVRPIGARLSEDDRLKVLAASLRLTENFTPPGQAIKEFEELLEQALSIKDRRVIANALDALSSIRQDRHGWIERLTAHDDNRVAANALVHEGLREISPFVVKRLRKMLRSNEALRVSSALYALGEIALHHRRRDRVYLHTRLDFQSLVQEVPGLVFHDDERVRRQALVAARKIGDTKIQQTILDLAHDPRHEHRLKELSEALEIPAVRSGSRAA